jgi:hypothetical protein
MARAKYTTTKVAKKKMDQMSEKIATDFGYNSPKTKVAPTPKGSVAKTFDVTKITGKLTPQDKASLEMLKKKYGKDSYKSYG